MLQVPIKEVPSALCYVSRFWGVPCFISAINLSNSCTIVAFVGRVAKKVHKDPFKSVERDFIKEVCKHLSDIQKAFVLLLADPKSKQVGRESCQLGLAACYAISAVLSDKVGSDMTMQVSSDVLNESLLRAFGQTSNHGGSALMENRSQQEERVGSAAASMMERFGTETEVGGAAGMSEAALGAFREMASASIVLNRPDILYSLMLLSVSLPTWRSTDYNAVTLLGDTVGASGNIEEIRLALRPHLKKLIPRLLRACEYALRYTPTHFFTNLFSRSTFLILIYQKVTTRISRPANRWVHCG